MTRILLPMSMLSLLSIGAIFGFFYAWVCSTMWGLDATDPRVAITAMQAMNASVRNPVFLMAFFLTPFILVITGIIAVRLGKSNSGPMFIASATLYVAGALLVTVVANVPINEALAQVAVPIDNRAAAKIWQDYSGPWQFWNTLRTLVSGVSLLLAGLAIHSLNSEAT